MTRPHLTLVPPRPTGVGSRLVGSDWQESAERAIADLDSALSNYSDNSLMPRELLLTLRRQLAERAGGTSTSPLRPVRPPDPLTRC